MSNKFFTLHPDGKNGVNIDLEKYNLIKHTILKIIKEHKEITYQNLNKLAVERLMAIFQGSIPWYVVTVKLDLEARKIIDRLPETSPQRIRLVK